MAQIPYNSYRGRKRRGRSVLIGVAAALVILLAAVLAGYYLGLFGVSPQGGSVPDPTRSAAPSDPALPSQEPVVIVDTPTPAPSPSPSPAAVDLSAYVPRDLPLGLTLARPDALPTGGRNGALVDASALDLAQADPALSESLAALPYAAAWLDPDWSALAAPAEDAAQAAPPEDLTARCAALAALGFDEIVLSAASPAEVSAPALAQNYADLRSSLAAAGWRGRLGLDLDQSWFSAADGDALLTQVAQSFDRLYFRSTLSRDHRALLEDRGFVANGYTIVTVVSAPASLNFAWAVLP